MNKKDLSFEGDGRGFCLLLMNCKDQTWCRVVGVWEGEGGFTGLDYE